MAAIAPFQQAYLGACLTRMSDAATAAFPGGSRAPANLSRAPEVHRVCLILLHLQSNLLSQLFKALLCSD